MCLATRDVRTKRDLAIYRLAGPRGRAERIFELSRGRVIRRIGGSRMGGITAFELDTLGLERIIPVSGRLFRIVGVKDNLVVYLDNPIWVPRGGPDADFVDLETQREVKRIELDEGAKCVFQNQ